MLTGTQRQARPVQPPMSFGMLRPSRRLLRRFPYALLYKIKPSGIRKIATQGVLSENIIVLSKNGIEHYYPPPLLAAAFRCDETDVGRIPLGCEPVEYNGHRYVLFVAGLANPDYLVEIDAIAVVPQE